MLHQDKLVPQSFSFYLQEIGYLLNMITIFFPALIVSNCAGSGEFSLGFHYWNKLPANSALLYMTASGPAGKGWGFLQCFAVMLPCGATSYLIWAACTHLRGLISVFCPRRPDHHRPCMFISWGTHVPTTSLPPSISGEHQIRKKIQSRRKEGSAGVWFAARRQKP